MHWVLKIAAGNIDETQYNGVAIIINYAGLTSVCRNENRLPVQSYGRRQVLGMSLNILTFELLISVSCVFVGKGDPKISWASGCVGFGAKYWGSMVYNVTGPIE